MDKVKLANRKKAYDAHGVNSFYYDEDERLRPPDADGADVIRLPSNDGDGVIAFNEYPAPRSRVWSSFHAKPNGTDSPEDYEQSRRRFLHCNAQGFTRDIDR